MSVAEAFGHSRTTILGIQLRAINNITTLVVRDIQFHATNLGPLKAGTLLMDIDGVTYRIHFTLSEDALDQRTLQGFTKQRNPEYSEK